MDDAGFIILAIERFKRASSLIKYSRKVTLALATGVGNPEGSRSLAEIIVRSAWIAQDQGAEWNRGL